MPYFYEYIYFLTCSKKNESHKYTIREGYKWLKGTFEKVGWHYWVWNEMNVPKHVFIAWLGALGKLRTRDRLVRAGVCNTTNCLLCNQGQDTCMHLSFQCPFSKAVSNQVMNCLNIRVHGVESLYYGWKKWGRKYNSKKKQRICYTALAAVVYHVWAARNQTLWQDVVPCPSQVVQKIKGEVVWRAKTKLTDRWPAEDKDWLQLLEDTVQ